MAMEKGEKPSNPEGMEKVAKPSNLESFLYSVTPVVPSAVVSKAKIKIFESKWYSSESKEKEYPSFRLRDFWNCFDEWSVYGIGVPLTLKSGQRIIQYYQPYLSAAEIYTSHSYALSLSTKDKEADDKMKSDYSWSDECSCDEGVARLGYSYLHFSDHCNPYARFPLLEKVYELSRSCPGLMSLSSTDLAPASWMSVAWYPMYSIPMVGTRMNELSTCFLTYHTLSSTFLDADADVEVKDDIEKVKARKKKGGGGLRLAPFALATHKLQGNIWISAEKDKDKLVSMLGVADSWLKQLIVEHHDFNYFTANRRG